jgi:hypothetical protein
MALWTADGKLLHSPVFTALVAARIVSLSHDLISTL